MVLNSGCKSKVTNKHIVTAPWWRQRSPTRVAGAGHVGTKVRVAATWQGDKKTAQRDLSELLNGDQNRFLDRSSLKVMANTGEIIAHNAQVAATK